MSSLGETVSRLSARRKASGRPDDWGVLTPLPAFGSNPGKLDGAVYVPPGLARGAPLVVVLHGCTQTAAGYDRGSGWSALAADHGFVLLFPQQNRANNPNLCFNWFVPGDVTRGHGEAESIRQMIAATIAAHGIDPARVFITGLSAGGAMTASMLATSPEMFAGGAIIAGVPHAAAGSVNEAFERMRGQGLPGAAAAAATIRAASHHNGPWPRLSVWHGSADTTVDPANADAIAAGWARLQGLGPPATETVGGHRRRVWRDAKGEAIESFTIAGMGHGTPITAQGNTACGTPMPHMLDVGISSTRHIAAFWGIAPAVAPADAVPLTRTSGMPPMPPMPGGVADVINSALRQAGLMR